MAELDRFMAAIRAVESSNNYRAVGPSTKYGRATGAYQFLDSTWNNFGGYRQAKDAPPAIQDARAAQLMTQYFQQFGSWDLVAVAWHGGLGAARKARSSGKITGRDSVTTTSNYVSRVSSIMGQTVGRGTVNPTARLASTSNRPQQTTAQLVAQIGREIERAFNVRISSHERTASRNSAVGGAKNSDHLWGGALDLVGAQDDLDRLAEWAKGNPMFRWVGWQVAGHFDHAHLSFNKTINVPPNMFSTTANLASYTTNRPQFALTMQGVSSIFGTPSPLAQQPVSLTGSFTQAENQMLYSGMGNSPATPLPYTFAEYGSPDLAQSAAPASARISPPTTQRPTPTRTTRQLQYNPYRKIPD